MLLKINCTEISSVKVDLSFDDGTIKNRLLAQGDLIDVYYNSNGVRKHIIGKISSISTIGTDPKEWYVVVDGSGDFSSEKVRFSPMSILDCEIIRKDGQDQAVKTPLGENGVPYIRIMGGRLQYSVDGYDWNWIRISDTDVIEEQSGTAPIIDQTTGSGNSTQDDDGIEDANW